MPLWAVKASPGASLTPQRVVVARSAWLFDKLFLVIEAVEAGRAERVGWSVSLGARLTDEAVLASSAARRVARERVIAFFALLRR